MSSFQLGTTILSCVILLRNLGIETIKIVITGVSFVIFFTRYSWKSGIGRLLRIEANWFCGRKDLFKLNLAERFATLLFYSFGHQRTKYFIIYPNKNVIFTKTHRELLEDKFLIRIRNSEIQRKPKVAGEVRKICNFNWRREGHFSRGTSNHWEGNVEWQPWTFNMNQASFYSDRQRGESSRQPVTYLERADDDLHVDDDDWSQQIL